MVFGLWGKVAPKQKFKTILCNISNMFDQRHLQWASQQVFYEHQVKGYPQSQSMDAPLTLKPEGWITTLKRLCLQFAPLQNLKRHIFWCNPQNMGGKIPEGSKQ